MLPGLTLPLVVPLKLVRLVLLAISAARAVVGTMLTLPDETRLAGDVTDAVSGLDGVAAEEFAGAGEVESLVEVFDADAAGLV
jgi:hypothetical protein